MTRYLLFTLFVFSISFAQENTNGWKFSGQLQLRSELDGRDFSNKTYPLTFASLRTRFGVEKAIDDKLVFFLQAQDSRVLGEEPTLTSNIKNLDLHQGFVKLIRPFEIPVTVQAGRFEMQYGTERFIGASNWVYTGRSFNGIRCMFDVGAKLDIWAITQNENVAYISSATPTFYSFPSKQNQSVGFYGFWMSKEFDEKQKLDLFAYYEINRKMTNGENKDVSVITVGLNHNGKYGDISTITEAAYQLGKRSIKDVSAYLFSITLNYKIKDIKIGLATDFLSGTKPSVTDKFSTFVLSFGTGHKYLGYMDYYFKNTLTNTLGINDIYLTTSLNPENSNFSGGINIHHFSSAQKSRSGQKVFGQEIDLTIKYEFIKNTSINWGFSLFLPGDLMKSAFLTSLGEERKDMAYWSYLMIIANI